MFRKLRDSTVENLSCAKGGGMGQVQKQLIQHGRAIKSPGFGVRLTSSLTYIAQET